MSIQKKKLFILLGAIALIAVLYFQPTQIVSKKEKEEAAAPGDFFTRILSQAKGSLKRQELEPLAKLEADLENANAENKVLLLDSLAHSWQRLRVPALAAHYLDEKATLAPEEKNEMEAGSNYFEAFGLAGDTGLKAYLIQGAIRNYEKVLARNPENLDAKSDLALCYAEGTTNPMQGIMLLRDVVTKNPKHEGAQFNLGILSVRSGQLDKAIERFNNVLVINPARYDVYFLRGTTYMRLCEKEKALSDLKKVKNESGDAAMISEADNYISELNKH